MPGRQPPAFWFGLIPWDYVLPPITSWTLSADERPTSSARRARTAWPTTCGKTCSRSRGRGRCGTRRPGTTTLARHPRAAGRAEQPHVDGADLFQVVRAAAAAFCAPSTASPASVGGATGRGTTAGVHRARMSRSARRYRSRRRLVAAARAAGGGGVAVRSVARRLRHRTHDLRPAPAASARAHRAHSRPATIKDPLVRALVVGPHVRVNRRISGLARLAWAVAEVRSRPTGGTRISPRGAWPASRPGGHAGIAKWVVMLLLVFGFGRRENPVHALHYQCRRSGSLGEPRRSCVGSVCRRCNRRGWAALVAFVRRQQGHGKDVRRIRRCDGGV